jgi:iron complex outermembrane receptor protein
LNPRDFLNPVEKLLKTRLPILLVSAALVVAQSGPGKVQGRVSDDQQLTLPQPKVELQGSQRTVTLTSIGDGEGHYEIDGVTPGTWTARFSRDGFTTVTKGPIVIAAGQIIVLDAVLPPARLEQSVTVAASVDDRQIGSKSDIPPQDLPVTVDTVPRELIQEQGATEIASVVNNLPGATGWTQYGSLNYFTFRGFQMDKDPGSAVLLNGLRIEGNRFDSQINSVDSVEVLKGPAAMTYGTEDTGGTINIVEKKPQSVPAYEVVLHESRWDTAGIEFGATGPLLSDKLQYRADVAYMHSDGFREAGYNKLNLSPKLHWRMGSRNDFSAYLSYNRDRYDMDAGIPLLGMVDNTDNSTSLAIPNVPMTNRYNTPGNFEYANLPVLQAFYNHQFSEKVRFRQAFQYQYIGDQYWDSEFLSIDSTIPSAPQVDRGYLYFYHRSHAVVSQSDFVADFHWLWNHKFLAGYEYDWYRNQTERSEAAENADVPPINLYNPIETAATITSFPISRYDGFRNRSNAVYLQDYIRVHPKLQILLSGRFDGYNRYSFLYPVVNGIEMTAANYSIFNQRPFTYRAGLNSQLLSFLSIYGSYSTSFQAQTMLSTDGAPLKPETGAQAEIGARLNFFQNRFTLNASVYHIIQRNVAVERADGVVEQAGQQYAKGAEALLRARVSQRLNVFASYGFTQTAFDNFISEDLDGTFLNLRGYVPGLTAKHTARVWTSWELPHGFSTSAGMRYLSRRAVDQFDHFWIGGFTTWGAAVRYRHKRMDYSVNLTNFLDKTHYFISAIDDTQIYPGPPIDIAVTARYRF